MCGINYVDLSYYFRVTLCRHLSETGLTHCAEQCGGKGWTVTTGNLKKIALDVRITKIFYFWIDDEIPFILIILLF